MVVYGDFCAQAVERMRPLATPKKLELDVRVDGNANRHMLVDPTQVSQVIANRTSFSPFVYRFVV